MMGARGHLQTGVLCCKGLFADAGAVSRDQILGRSVGPKRAFSPPCSRSSWVVISRKHTLYCTGPFMVPTTSKDAQGQFGLSWDLSCSVLGWAWDVSRLDPGLQRLRPVLLPAIWGHWGGHQPLVRAKGDLGKPGPVGESPIRPSSTTSTDLRATPSLLLWRPRSHHFSAGSRPLLPSCGTQDMYARKAEEEETLSRDLR